MPTVRLRRVYHSLCAHALEIHHPLNEDSQRVYIHYALPLLAPHKLRPLCGNEAIRPHITKTLTLVCLFLTSLILAGCSSTRPIGDAALGAGGALIAQKLSNGNTAATVAGAAGGVLVSEGLHWVANKQNQKAYFAGYDKGKSDAVKQQYWLQVAQQHDRSASGQVRLYPIQLPEQRIDGVTFQPSTKLLRIEE